MTIRNIINECMTYPYSTEAISLKRECAEVALMDLCIESSSISKTIRSTMSSDYIKEYTGNEIQTFVEKTEAKKKSIWSIIKEGFFALLRRVAAVFRGLMKKAEEAKTAATKASQKIAINKGMSLTAATELLNKLKACANECHIKSGESNKKLKLDNTSKAIVYDEQVSDDIKTELNQYLIMALNGTVFVSYHAGDTGKGADPISAPELTKMYEKFVELNKNKITGTTANNERLQDAFTVGRELYDCIDGNKKGVKITISSDDFGQISTEVTRIMNELNEAGAKADSFKGIDELEYINQYYTDLVKTTGATLSVYTGILSYRLKSASLIM